MEFLIREWQKGEKRYNNSNKIIENYNRKKQNLNHDGSKYNVN